MSRGLRVTWLHTGRRSSVVPGSWRERERAQLHGLTLPAGNVLACHLFFFLGLEAMCICEKRVGRWFENLGVSSFCPPSPLTLLSSPSTLPILLSRILCLCLGLSPLLSLSQDSNRSPSHVDAKILASRLDAIQPDLRFVLLCDSLQGVRKSG